MRRLSTGFHPIAAHLGLALIVLLFAVAARATAEAEIISVIGKAEKRETVQAEWTPAAPRQTVKPGGFVRTREMSQMAILLPDRTQLRLNQNSQMQIKSVADAAEWNQSAVRLNAGRAWSQARPPTAPAGSGAPATRITMETPSATLSIRGTDWEVEVGPDGRTQLVVLSGEVNIGNEQGALKVGAGETATAEIGKAPVRLILANPAGRVQWVTAWQVQARRWVPLPSADLVPVLALLDAGDYAAAAQRLRGAGSSLQRDLLEADLAVMGGETQRAIELLAPHVDSGKGPPLASALLARAHLARGAFESAAALLAAARATYPRETELWLATAELGLFQGDVRMAREALAHCLALDHRNAEAWFLQGSLETERENIRAAQVALESALAARPDFPRALAERGTLDTLAGDYASALRYFDKALAVAPDNYIALTGRGILKLKSGDSAGALEDFLRAGVIEPHFGRAWLYSAAAFYQLGEAGRARDALVKATELDPRDPLPHVMLGLIAADALDLGGAVDAARRAQERMPYLKSLNQVQNNQKGSANLGSALAEFGLEDWARHYATMAYSPWWAGSHLFVADRHAPGFNKNSELFKGFITDPTVFGASPRHSALIATPGHYGRVDLFMEQADWQQSALIGAANGMAATPVPLAYFVSGDMSDGHSRRSADSADGTNLTLGLGMRPHHALGVFAFGTDTQIRGDLNNPTLPNDLLAIDDTRMDLGINLRYDANNQFWLKSGAGRQSALVSGRVAIPALVPLERFLSRVKQSDTQFRHAFEPADGLWLSWGYEDSRQEKPANFDIRIAPAIRLAISEVTGLHSSDAYFVARIPVLDSLRGELGVFEQRARSGQRSESRLNGAILGTPLNTPRTYEESNWRGGLQWRFAPLSTLTAVSQKWRRPASVGSLAPIDTLGIAVNDRLTTNGGLYRRNRIQADHEAGPSSFVQGFVDHESVSNITSPLSAVVPDLQLTQLESLRSRRDAFTVAPELEAAPKFLEGRARTYGLALNHRHGRDHTLAARYWRSNAQQTGLRNGLRIPYLPRDYLRFASHWSLPERLLLGATATWRGERFRDEANTAALRIDAGWTFGLSSYWESADKRWVLQAMLDNLRRNRSAADERATKLIMRASYLF